MLDHHHAERLGTKYKDQSTTEIETSSHGSEVCNCRVQRGFFSLLVGSAASPLTIAASLRKIYPLAPRVGLNRTRDSNKIEVIVLDDQ